MENILSKIGKLKTKRFLDFIELENQIAPTRDQVIKGSGRTIYTLKKITNNVKNSFLTVEEAIQEYIDRIDREIQSLKIRLGQANLC